MIHDLASALHLLLLLLPLPLLSGCAPDDAILELELVLPASGGSCDARTACVEAAFARDTGGTGVCGFEVHEWATGDELDGVALDASPSVLHVSVVAEGEDVAQPLCVRMRFPPAGCQGLGIDTAPHVGLRVEPAFAGERFTQVRVTIPDACPAADTDLGTFAAEPVAAP